MANKVTISDDKNRVTITPQSTNKINTSTTNTPITVTQGTNSIVQINTPGPRGPAGINATLGNIDGDLEIRNITASGTISASSIQTPDLGLIGDFTVGGNLTISGSESEIILISESAEERNVKIYNDNDNLHLEVSTGQGKNVIIGGDSNQHQLRISDGSNQSIISGYFKFDTPPNDSREQVLINRRTNATHPGLKIAGNTISAPDILTEQHIEIGTNISAGGFITAPIISASNNISTNDVSASGNIIAKKWLSPDDDNTFIQFLGDNLVFHVNNQSQMALNIGPQDTLFNSANDPDRDFKIGTGTTDEFFVIDSGQDTLTISGNITASGNISASGDVSATSFIASGSNTTSGFVFPNPDDLTDFDTNRITLTSAKNMQFRAGNVFQFNKIVEILDGNALLLKNNGNQSRIQLDNVGTGIESRFRIRTGSVELVTVSGSGKVGIGTSNPSQLLTVSGGFIMVTGSGPAGYGYLLDRAGLDRYEIRHLDGGLTIKNATDNRKEMTFDGGGNVGIGTNNPTKTLTVEGDISGSGTGSFENLKLNYDNMPTSDPSIKGVVYRSSSLGLDNLLFISPG